MKTKIVLSILLLAVGAAACSPAVLNPTSTSTGSIHPGEVILPGTMDVPTTTPEVFNPLPGDQAVFEAVRKALAEILGVDPLSITLVSVEPVQWSDSCLGAGGAAEICAQVITPGYRVVVKYSDKTYEFHTNQDGTQVRQAQ